MSKGEEIISLFRRLHMLQLSPHDINANLFIFGSFIVTIIILIQVYFKIKPSDVSPTLPGPKRHPFIGITKFLINHWDTFPSTCHLMCEKYKGTWGGPVPNFGGLTGAFIFINSQQNLKHILSDNFDNYEKGHGWRDPFRELLGEGIFAANGSKWMMHRKITSNMFSRNLLRHMATVTSNKIDEAFEVIDEKLRTTDTINIDIQDLFFRMTFDTTSMVAFGVEFDSIRKEKQHDFALAFDEIQELILERFHDPLFVLARLLRLTRRERRIRELKSIIDDYAMTIINSKRRTAEEGSTLGPDLISRFIDYSHKHHDPITNATLRDVIMNIMLAGRDTTACALSWTFYELTKHPSVIQKIIHEVQTICGTTTTMDSSSSDAADYISHKTISQLKYTHAVIMEVLRLHPSLPNDLKYAIKQDILPDGTYIPNGAAVCFLPYSMGRNKDIWGVDADEFRPERFLNQKEPSPFAFSAFNAGPRLCLGKSLAIQTMKIVLARILTRYVVEDEVKHGGEYRWTTVRSMKGGFGVRLSRRV